MCKHFLDAVERKQYGWFWTCPNGGKDCHYRHALPPGYVLKSQMKALLEEEGEKLTIEEEIENQVCIEDRSERRALSGWMGIWGGPYRSVCRGGQCGVRRRPQMVRMRRVGTEWFGTELWYDAEAHDEDDDPDDGGAVCGLEEDESGGSGG